MYKYLFLLMLVGCAPDSEIVVNNIDDQSAGIEADINGDFEQRDYSQYPTGQWMWPTSQPYGWIVDPAPPYALPPSCDPTQPPTDPKDPCYPHPRNLWNDGVHDLFGAGYLPAPSDPRWPGIPFGSALFFNSYDCVAAAWSCEYPFVLHSPAFPVYAGEQVDVQVYVMNSLSFVSHGFPAGVTYGVEWLDSTQAILSTDSMDIVGVGPTDWTQYQSTFTAPGNTIAGRVRLVVQKDNRFIYIDKVRAIAH